MTSKNTLSAKNLEALGAMRLAELLIEISTGNATAKRSGVAKYDPRQPQRRPTSLSS